MTSSFRLPRAVTVEASAVRAAAPWSLAELPTTASTIVAGSRPPLPDDSALDTAREEGHARGYELGFREGAFAEASRLRSAVAAVESALAAVEERSARWTANAEENLCALAIAVARHLAGGDFPDRGAEVLAQVKRALEEFPVLETLLVRLCPGDLHAVTAAMPPHETLGGHAVRWTADPRLTPGSYFIEGPERIIDGRVDVALERLFRRLANVSR